MRNFIVVRTRSVSKIYEGCVKLDYLPGVFIFLISWYYPCTSGVACSGDNPPPPQKKKIKKNKIIYIYIPL